ncbi:putative centromere kinetochore protein zw10 protein [Botrytis cinerea BcDW1]|uniref:Similar to centromere/kinetochore protein zw10 n=2 Tax=Botryotinia fuckeliana TaxID=40559 RepID=G2XQ87_BOTF4|nr:putative centromere kinetochore protein zw10 protein [Botrytis cinerea BcDW1]CCD42975.1 similar to centromere/kinetochore protein zw10 [Botrytis cinerea T4]
MASTIPVDQLSKTLIGFASNGEFPNEEVSASAVGNEALPLAIEALGEAKLSLEAEVRQVSRDFATDIDKWIQHAQALQDDIDKSRKLANEVVQQAEADESRVTDVHNHENHVELLVKEIEFNAQLLECAQSIKRANDSLDKAVEQAGKQEIHEALKSLDAAGHQIAEIPAETTVRAVRLLDTRYYELKESLNNQLSEIRKSLIYIQPKEASITIHKRFEGISTSLDDVAIGLERFEELEEFGKNLWEQLSETVIRPRTGLESSPSVFQICIEDNTLRVTEDHSDTSIKSLFRDILGIIRFLDENLPKTMVESLSKVMMPDLTEIIIGTWLETSVPTSLDDMVDYEKALGRTSEFAETLQKLGWPGAERFYEWVSSAAKIWLTKKRETSLDRVRNALALGVGQPLEAKRVEMRMVTRDDGMHVASNGETVKDDWGWGEEDEEEETQPISRSRASFDEERRASSLSIAPDPNILQVDDEDAWGWGDDNEIAVETPADEFPDTPKTQNDPYSPTSPTKLNDSAEKRNVTLSEKYWTSSIPLTIFNHVVTIYEDGAKLMQPEQVSSPVSPAAGGLSKIPTLILAMYRAVSPCYYVDDPKGNMFAYNDATWLVDKLKSFSKEWHLRKDITPRATNLVNIDSEIGPLESFGKRAYKNEMDTQRTILHDLLGGSQNFVYNDSENAIRAVIGHINQQSASWKEILPSSTWVSAVGTLVNTVATKIISDIFELTDLGVDDAERIAALIQQVEALESLFKENEIGTYAGNWLKMQFLSEVLQSNLKDIRYLWFESHLSLYFSKDEVRDLIELSFENNLNVRSLIKDIKEKPLPDVGRM